MIIKRESLPLRAVRYVAAGAAVLSVIAALLCLGGCKPDGFTVPDMPGARKYASDYGLEIGEERYRVLGKWAVSKREADGNVCLVIRYPGTKREEIDYLDFTVYDSPRAAKKQYNKQRESLSDYLDEEGENWFTAYHYEILDAVPLRMHYLAGSVIISADIEMSDYEYGYFPDEGNTVSDSSAADADIPGGNAVIDRRWLKDYVIDNAESLKSYVLDDILRDGAQSETEE